MVVKKEQLRIKKQEPVNTFEKFLFLLLGSLSLVFLFITCWILMTGDEVILLHGSNFAPGYFSLSFSLEGLILGRIISLEYNNNSELEQFFGSFSPSWHL